MGRKMELGIMKEDEAARHESGKLEFSRKE